jgi:MSHA biogenesis protein MshO
LAFTVVGGLPAGVQAIVPGRDRIVVYNLGPGQAPADAYTGGNIATVTGVAAGSNTVTLSSNPFSAQTPRLSSPARRFHVVETPVTYVCDPTAGSLTRFWGYPITAAQPNNPAAAPLSSGQNALLARGVVGCAFQYGALGNLRIGLVGLGLTMLTPGSASGTVVLFDQVHVDNTP